MKIMLYIICAIGIIVLLLALVLLVCIIVDFIVEIMFDMELSDYIKERIQKHNKKG